MSPQLEDGYTRIADAILEKIAKTKLNGTQFRILMVVWRSTYGWQKKEHELSLGFLSKATNIHKQQIKKELDKLIEMNIITVIEKHTNTKPRKIGFNKNYANCLQESKKVTVSENAYPTVSKLTDPTVSEFAYQNKDLNKQYKDSNKVIDYYKYICYKFSQPRKITDKRIGAINARLKEYGLKETLTVLEKVSESKFLNDSIKSNWLDFDWIFNPNNFVKIIEGKYDTKVEANKNGLIGAKAGNETPIRRIKDW